jgi:hypothetical protein
MKKLALLSVILLSTTGCFSLLGVDTDSNNIYDSQTEAYDINAPNQKLAEIDVYFGVNTKPKTNYIQLAYLEVSTSEGISMKEFVNILKDEAKKKGADAVMEIHKKTVISITSSGSVVHKERGYRTISDNTLILTGIAIKYIESPAAQSGAEKN